MDLGLQGKRALVTGASKGIGLSCAQALIAEGASVVLVARDADRLAQARAKLGPAAAVFAADLSKDSERARLAAAHPEIDILVNNAGAIPGGNVLDISLDAWRDAWSLKVFGYIHMTQLYLDAMMKKRAGVIVNIIGLAGVSPAMRPDWWLPWAEAQAVMRSRAKPLAELIARRPEAAALLQAAAQSAGRDVKDLTYLPLVSSKTLDWVALLDADLNIVGHAPVDGF